MEVDINNGICIESYYDYWTYNKNPNECPCNESITHVTGNTNTGLYIKLYVNTNNNYSVGIIGGSSTMSVDNISEFINNYILDLSTTGYTGYENSDIEERVIYSESNGKYYYIEHTYNFCNVNEEPMLAITNSDGTLLFNGTGDYYYPELDDCGNPTGNNIIYLTDINKNSPTYELTDSIYKCD